MAYHHALACISSAKLMNGMITISKLSVDSEYKCHFEFDINILTTKISKNYHFGEVVYFKMFDFINLKEQKLKDEMSLNNYLEVTKQFFVLTTNQDGIISEVKLNFENCEDQENLDKFLIKLREACEELRKN